MGIIWRMAKSNLLLVGIFTALVLAWFFPLPGMLLADLKLSSLLIFFIFFLQGTVITGGLLENRSQLVRIILWGVVVSQALGPLTGYAMMKFLGWDADFYLGFMLMCCMAPTLVSGIVLATRAGGDQESAVLLTVGINLLAVAAIPMNLLWSAGAVVKIDQWELLQTLVVLVLLPSLAGWLVRQQRPSWVEQGSSLIRYGPVVALSVVIYLSLAVQVERVKEIEVMQLAGILWPALIVHIVLLAVGYWGARHLFSISEPACRSLAVVCSQKTLPMAVAIWAVTFAHIYPLAIIPPLVFHFGQIVFDGVLAARWKEVPM